VNYTVTPRFRPTDVTTEEEEEDKEILFCKTNNGNDLISAFVWT